MIGNKRWKTFERIMIWGGVLSMIYMLSLVLFYFMSLKNFIALVLSVFLFTIWKLYSSSKHAIRKRIKRNVKYFPKTQDRVLEFVRYEDKLHSFLNLDTHEVWSEKTPKRSLSRFFSSIQKGSMVIVNKNNKVEFEV